MMGMRTDRGRVTDGTMDDNDAVILDGLASLELDQSQPAIYDRPIGVRLLHHDPTSGAEHYLIRYPAGLQAGTHRHTAAHTIVVLEGRLQANGREIGPGSYCHFPAGVPMHHAPADGRECLFVTIFHGPFDVQPD
jgi:quercetin dioxygenase-like cupin family protein